MTTSWKFGNSKHHQSMLLIEKQQKKLAEEIVPSNRKSVGYIKLQRTLTCVYNKRLGEEIGLDHSDLNDLHSVGLHVSTVEAVLSVHIQVFSPIAPVRKTINNLQKENYKINMKAKETKFVPLFTSIIKSQIFGTHLRQSRKQETAKISSVY